MGRDRKFKYFVGDFETTVYDGQTSTEVWASAVVELNTEDVEIHHSISETFRYLENLKCNLKIYYHNLKFDGEFWLYYLIYVLKYRQAIKNGEYVSDNDMWLCSWKCLISNMSQWYSVTIKTQYGKYIIIQDSLKLLPFSVKAIGKSFKTKHQKLDMEYIGYRYAGCEITNEEKKYIANDVLVVKEALEIMFEEGHRKLTIGGCCLDEFKNTIKQDECFDDYDTFFVDLNTMKIDKEIYGEDNADRYIRNSYRGGWCYLARGKENKIYNNGITIDVNSLYPSVMSSQSGSRYPMGHPQFWSGNYIPEIAQKDDTYFFIRFECRFKIKDGYLPFVQIKRSLLYKSTEMLETSDVYNKFENMHFRYYYDIDGEIKEARVQLTMTQTDWYLFNEHYNIFDLEILDGCWFYTKIGIFDNYINKYREMKMNSTGARRQLAKLFLNNLYGKMATSPYNSIRIPYEMENGTVGYAIHECEDKKSGDIAVGSAITSYAREFTIRTAQKNYYGKDNKGFIYADTDSIHCDLDISEIKGAEIDDKEFCHWAHESSWDYGLFVRQKTYVEHNKDNGEYDIKCAGMPQHCKDLFLMSMGEKESDNDLSEDELLFIQEKRYLADFKKGLIIPGKLRPVRTEGGVILVDTTYEMR